MNTLGCDKRIIISKNNDSFIYFTIINNRIYNVSLYDSSKFNVGDIVVCKVEKKKKELNGYFVKLSKDVNGLLFEEDVIGDIKNGDEICVQIKKEAHDNKVAVVSMSLELSSLYSVVSNITQNNKISYSKKLTKEFKENFKNYINNNELSDIDTINYSVLLRTACENTEPTEIVQNLIKNINKLKNIKEKAKHASLYSKLYYNSNPLKDLLKNDLNTDLAYNGEIICLDKDSYLLIKEQLCEINLNDYGYYLYDDETIPAFVKYGIKSKLDDIVNNKVWLKSGGYLFIEQTKAFHVIDVNMGKADYKCSKEDAVLKTNEEAAAEIAYQIAARNLSGIILVDFINFSNKFVSKDFLEKFNYLIKNCSNITTKVVDITKLGIVEISREKTSIDIYEIIKKIDKNLFI